MCGYMDEMMIVGWDRLWDGLGALVMVGRIWQGCRAANCTLLLIFLESVLRIKHGCILVDLINFSCFFADFFDID